ncbi:hypothetical protein G3I44_14330 [Halogeometricum borinquense]|uniref:Uncharacterized protein n=1 Tax=Halogeometricum borinquense TaxID=60847 RepID=A0A6C0UL93_9EURY|nr:hypothetical protein [Halogeometricum borinquense]QIB75363.1 hypothetical protein G3I44_14330 [Halogeometricum borinquense]
MTDINLTPSQILPLFIEWVNDRGTVRIDSSSAAGNGKRYFINRDRGPDYSKQLDQLPEETHPVFDRFVSQGYSPRVIAAAIDSLATYDSVVEAAEAFGCSPEGVRNNLSAVREALAEYGIDSKRS